MLEKINGAWWAKINPTPEFSTGGKQATKINVQLMHDDMVESAQFKITFVTDGLDWICERFVDIHGDDYAEWNMHAHSGYELAAEKMGVALVDWIK